MLDIVLDYWEKTAGDSTVFPVLFGADRAEKSKINRLATSGTLILPLKAAKNNSKFRKQLLNASERITDLKNDLVGKSPVFGGILGGLAGFNKMHQDRLAGLGIGALAGTGAGFLTKNLIEFKGDKSKRVINSLSNKELNTLRRGYREGVFGVMRVPDYKKFFKFD